MLLDNPSIAMRRRKVEVREHFDGQITIKFKDRYLDFHEVFEAKPMRIEKVKKPAMEKKREKGKYRPSMEHPWKKYDYKDMFDRC